MDALFLIIKKKTENQVSNNLKNEGFFNQTIMSFFYNDSNTVI